MFFVIMIFSLFLFTGCQEKNVEISDDYILLSISIDDQGNVLQSINFGVNSEKIKEKCQKKEEYLTFVSNLIENVKKLHDEFLFTFALKYMENPVAEVKINSGVVLSNAVYFTQSDSVGFSIKYSSSAWNFYNSNGDKNAKNIDNRANIFIQKHITKSKFIFSTLTSENVLVGERYKSMFLDASKGLSFEKNMNDYHPDFVYSYSSPHGKIRSNADMTFTNNNQTFHVWKVEEDNLSHDNDIVIWYSEINYGMWYLSALVIVLVPTIIFLTIHLIKNKKTGRAS